MPDPLHPAEAGGARPSDGDAPARGFLQAFYAASRLGAMWGFDSRLSDDAMGNLEAALRGAASSQGEVVLRFADDLVFLNGTRLRVDAGGFLAYQHLHERVRRRGIGEITFSVVAQRRELEQLLTLLETRLAGTLTPDEAFDASRTELARAAVVSVTLAPPQHLQADRGNLGPTDVRQAAIQAYFRLLFVADRTQAAVREGRRFQVRRCKRVVHEIVDVLERGEHLALAMAQVKNYHGFAACHAANTAVLACAVGFRVGLHKLRVADLGVAALLHEILPVDPSRLHEAALLERDRAAARTLLSQLGFADASLRAVLAARELHATSTAAGSADAPLSHRVLRAICFLDAQTSPAGPGQPDRPVREVLDVMARDGATFDPVIVRVLRAVVGIHPFGTIVRLDGGERAVVHGRNPHFDQPARPVVRILDDANGRRVAGVELADLSRWDRELGRFTRSIVEAVPPCRAFKRPADYVRVL